MLNNLAKIDDLVNIALTAEPEDFLRLIKSTILLLKTEQKSEKKVCGRLFYLQPCKVTIIGDVHGDLASLSHIIKDSGFVENAAKGKKHHLVFLGDYGDRGLASVEVYYLVLKVKEMFPDKIILMRGNHEGPKDLLAYPHDLPEQIKQKYGEEAALGIYKELQKLFALLYTAVLIDNHAILIHGGFPSEGASLQDLAYAHKKHPKKSFLEEMLWSDPEETISGAYPSIRGAGKCFGPDVTKRWLKLLNVKLLIRGHEFCEEGYKFNHKGKVLTLFSTNKPPYDNKYGAFIQIEQNKEFETMKTLRKCIRQFE